VSLPSVILAWFKLRARDLGAILNACGWAVNRPLYFSMGLARTFTRPAKLPMGSAVARDPYAKGGWWKVLLTLVLIVGIALGVCWKFKKWPFCCKKSCGAKTECTANKPAVAQPAPVDPASATPPSATQAPATPAPDTPAPQNPASASATPSKP
jgi:hypothetical protein